MKIESGPVGSIESCFRWAPGMKTECVEAVGSCNAVNPHPCTRVGGWIPGVGKNGTFQSSPYKYRSSIYQDMILSCFDFPHPEIFAEMIAFPPFNFQLCIQLVQV